MPRGRASRDTNFDRLALRVGRAAFRGWPTRAEASLALGEVERLPGDRTGATTYDAFPRASHGGET
jgi:hypothetical protein